MLRHALAMLQDDRGIVLKAVKKELAAMCYLPSLLYNDNDLINVIRLKAFPVDPANIQELQTRNAELTKHIKELTLMADVEVYDVGIAEDRYCGDAS